MSEEFELAEAAPSIRERYGMTGPVPIRAGDATALADGSIDPATLCVTLRDYISTRPEWGPAFKPMIARVAVDAGHAALAGGDWVAGADFAGTILDEHPGDRDARAMLVRALHGGERYAQAADLGDVLLDETDDVDPQLVVFTAEAHERSSRVTHALRLLDRYIAEDPDQPAYPAARAAIVERLAAAADAGDLPTPPRLTTNRNPAPVGEPVGDGAVDDEPIIDGRDVAAAAPPEPASTASLSLTIVLAGLLAGVGVALVLLAMF